MAVGVEFVIEKLAKAHDLSRFDCGKEALNLWLRRFAWMKVQNDAARVYIAHRRDRVVVRLSRPHCRQRKPDGSS
jgi:hypothetical protein